MRGNTLYNRLTATLLAAYYLLAVMLPAMPLLPSSTNAMADGSIVICTWDGTKLLNLADGSQRDLPNPSSRVPHCALCLLPGSQHAVLLPSAIEVIPSLDVKAAGYEGHIYAFHTSHHAKSAQPRAPPHPLA